MSGPAPTVPGTMAPTASPRWTSAWEERGGGFGRSYGDGLIGGVRYVRGGPGGGCWEGMLTSPHLQTYRVTGSSGDGVMSRIDDAAARVRPRRNPGLDTATTHLRVDLWNDDLSRWEQETTCTLAEFLENNTDLDVPKERFLRELAIRRQRVGGGGAWARWKVSLI